jgi:Secretion system C-terminal sorting domain
VAPSTPITLFAIATPPANYDYLWTKNNGINGTTNTDRIVVPAAEAKNYFVKVTSPSGCTASATSTLVTTTATNSLFIFPNPSNGIFNVSYLNAGANLNPAILNIYDYKGARVYTQSFTNTPTYSNMKVDMSKNAKGVYYAILLDAGGNKLAEREIVLQ